MTTSRSTDSPLPAEAIHKPQETELPPQGQPEPPPADTSWATMEEIRKAHESDYERR